MSICVWMFSESDIDSSVSKMKGMLVEITDKSGKTIKNVFSSESGEMVMETEI